MVTVILNVYKRPYTLEHQINAIKNQNINIPDENIWIWYNKSDVPQPLPNNSKHFTFQCNWNSKFHGRFTAALLAKTEYVIFLDDDIIPGKKSFENAIYWTNKMNGIMGGSGVLLNGYGYRPHEKFGWTGVHPNEPVRVDLCGHFWCIKQEWAKYMWYEPVYSFENGEDIAFSFLCQKYGGINTFAFPHPENDIDMWSNHPSRDNGWGNDKNASFIIKPNHYTLRDNICQYYIDKGWKTVKNLKK